MNSTGVPDVPPFIVKAHIVQLKTITGCGKTSFFKMDIGNGNFSDARSPL